VQEKTMTSCNHVSMISIDLLASVTGGEDKPGCPTPTWQRKLAAQITHDLPHNGEALHGAEAALQQAADAIYANMNQCGEFPGVPTPDR
jgi:hypothetical protein